MVVIKVIMREVFILGLIDTHPSIQGFDEGRWPETYPFTLERALIKPKINTKGSIPKFSPQDPFKIDYFDHFWAK